MSYSDFQTFSAQTVALDVQEKIELITILVKSLPKTDKENEVAKINAVLEKIPESEQSKDSCCASFDHQHNICGASEQRFSFKKYYKLA